MPEYIDRERVLNKIWNGNTDSIVLRTYASEIVKSIPAVNIQGETNRLRERLRHLLQSNTVRLFDEWDPDANTYKRDIRRLDTYGIDKKVLEFERTGSTRPCEVDGSTRPCEVDGKPAHFHRWVDMDVTLLRIDSWSTREEIDEILNLFKEKGVAPVNTHINTCRNVFALVEYYDGTVCKVEPEKVKFTDRRTAE